MHDTKNTMPLLELACEILMLIANASSYSLRYMHNFLVRLEPYFPIPSSSFLLCVYNQCCAASLELAACICYKYQNHINQLVYFQG